MIMTKNNIIASCMCLPLVLGLLGCEPVELTPSVPQSRLRVEALIQATKSSRDFSEEDISNLNVYAYRDGILDAESYSEGSKAVLELFPGVEYTLYALANTAQVHAPAKEADLDTLSLSPNAMAMVCRRGVSRTFSGTAASVGMELSRLYSKYILRLDRETKLCSYQVTGVRILSEADCVQPFSKASRARSCSDGDYASEEDVAALNAGEEVTFYVLENCQGKLLEGNTDPCLKTPDSLPEEYRGLCTSLCIEGKWTTSGATADMDINLMLGQDNCSDFSVVRNTAVSITLSVFDSGTIESSWRVALDEFEDERVLSFDSESVTVMQEDGWTEIPLTVYPSDMSFECSLLEGKNLQTRVENGKVYAKGLYEGDLRPVDTLVVESWDKRQRDTVALVLDYTYQSFDEVQATLPQYFAQYGTVSVPRGSEEKPVKFACASGWEAVFSPSGKTGWERYFDEDEGVEYYALYDDNMVVIRPLKGSVNTSFTVTRFKSRASYSLSSSYPALCLDDALISESGKLHYDTRSRFSYDSSARVYLAGSNAQQLSLDDFAAPTQLLGCGALSSQEPYAPFASAYGVPLISSSASSVSGSKTKDYSTDGYDFFRSNDCLALTYLYGTGDYAQGGEYYTLSASVQLSTGEKLFAESSLKAIEAFPDQRYLGSVYNYCIAPGELRSETAKLDFTSNGAYDSPSEQTLWSVRHSNSSYTNPLAAYSAGSADAYSKGVLVSGTRISFAYNSASIYPSSGCMALQGSITNPHTGQSFTGYYTVDLILYVSVGCSVDFPSEEGGNLTVRYVPFYEGSNEDNASMWRKMFPLADVVKSAYDSQQYKIVMGSGIDILDGSHFSVSGFNPAASLSQAVSQLKGREKELFAFSLQAPSQISFLEKRGIKGPVADSGSELLLDRSSMSLLVGPAYQNGSSGYYRLVRQYSSPCFDYGDKYNGLENYIIEAAYEDIDM